ncbi:MAG: DUF3782 domain-containing protein [Pseudomonadota bacterium]
MLTTQQIKEIILKELPAILEEDPEMHRFFLQLSRRHFADKAQTEDRFDRVLDELRRDREEQNRKWDEESRKWDAQNQKWDEENRKWDAQNQKWNEENRKWDAQNQKWNEENRKWDIQNQKWNEENRKWDEQNRKWETNQQVINEMLADIRALVRKHDTTIGALGARWGLHTEQAFRNALKGILEKFAGVEVLNITEYDHAGVVFGRPDQIELDIIINNGILIIVEIKSSMSKPEMYIFERKVRFYEERHQRKASEMIVISPMVAPNAMPVAEKLGIRIYSSAEDVRF